MNRADRWHSGLDAGLCFSKRKAHKWFTPGTDLEGFPWPAHGLLLDLSPTWTSTVDGARPPAQGCFTSCVKGGGTGPALGR